MSIRNAVRGLAVAFIALLGPHVHADDTTEYGARITDPAQIKGTMIGHTFGGVLEQTGQDG